MSPNKTILKLYLAGETVSARQIISSLHETMAEKLGDFYTLEVINLLDRPELAEDEQIIATPTLVKKLPEPVRKIIGDLQNKEKILVGLGLKE